MSLIKLTMSAGTREVRWWEPEVVFAVAQFGWQVWSREKWVGAVVHAWNPRSWGVQNQPGLCNKAVSTWRWHDLSGWLAAEQGCVHIGASVYKETTKGAPNGRNSEVEVPIALLLLLLLFVSLLFLILFWDRVSLGTPGWPWTHSPNQY